MMQAEAGGGRGGVAEASLSVGPERGLATTYLTLSYQLPSRAIKLYALSQLILFSDTVLQL